MKRFLAALPLLAFMVFLWANKPEGRTTASDAPKAGIDPPSRLSIMKENLQSTLASLPFLKPSEDALTAKVLDQIRTDTFCDGQGEFLLENGSTEASPVAVERALSLANRQGTGNPCLAAMLSKDRLAALTFAGKADSHDCRFIRALLLSDQWDGVGDRAAPSHVSPTREELTEAVSLLATLGAQHAENGIYPLFQLGALEQMSASRAEVEEALIQFLRAPTYTSPVAISLVKLKQQGLLNPTAYLLATSLIATTGVPNYGRAQKIMRELLRESAFATDAISWSRRIARRLRILETYKLREPAVMLLDEAILKSLAVHAWEIHAPNQKLPATIEVEKFKEIFRSVAGLDSGFNHIEFESGPGACRKLSDQFRPQFPVWVAEDKSRIEQWNRLGPF